MNTNTNSLFASITGAAVVASFWLLSSLGIGLFIGGTVALAAVAFAASEYAFGRRRGINQR